MCIDIGIGNDIATIKTREKYGYEDDKDDNTDNIDNIGNIIETSM